VERVVSILSDVTERRVAEDALRLSEANYRTLMESLDAAVVLKDADCRYVVVNKGFSDSVGLSQEDIVGKTSAEIFDDLGFVEAINAHDEEVLASRSPIREERREADGRIFDAHKAPVLDTDGNIGGIVGVMIDITDLRTAEEELRRVHDR
jgi:PAS domain S-box-containing protein